MRTHPDWQPKTIDGTTWRVERFCPSHPDVRRYLIALFSDLAAHYELDYIQTCQHLFNNLDIDQGGTCLCKYCVAKAARWGSERTTAIAVVKKHKNAQPQRNRWLAFRRDCTTRLHRDLAQAIRRENPRCHLRLNDVSGQAQCGI